MASIGVNITIQEADKILLIKREDFEVWCLPGGGLDPGESFAQAAAREAREETGLEVVLTRLVGIYSRTSIGELVEHIVLFAAWPISGALQPQEGEALDVRYFSEDAIPDDLVPWHRRRILDALMECHGLAWRQDYPVEIDLHMSRQELYDLRDRSDLSRIEFFHCNISGVGEDSLEVGDNAN